MKVSHLIHRSVYILKPKASTAKSCFKILFEKFLLVSLDSDLQPETYFYFDICKYSVSQ